MALTTRLINQVPAEIRSRGNDYQLRGAVNIRHGDNKTVRASVRGTEPYQVELKRTGATVRASCTCPYYDDNLDICKHIWATLLAAERTSYLGGSGGDPRDLIPAEEAEDYDDYDDEYDDDLDYVDEPGGAHGPWPVYPAPRQPPKPSPGAVAATGVEDGPQELPRRLANEFVSVRGAAGPRVASSCTSSTCPRLCRAAVCSSRSPTARGRKTATGASRSSSTFLPKQSRSCPTRPTGEFSG